MLGEPLLQKGVYENNKTGNPGPLTLVKDQLRIDPIIHHAVWFNGDGVRLGIGDLSIEDIRRMKMQIPAGEVFIALSLARGFTDFVDSTKSTLMQDPEFPGIDYVSRNCQLIVTKGSAYQVDGGIMDHIKDLIEITRDEVERLLPPQLPF